MNLKYIFYHQNLILNLAIINNSGQCLRMYGWMYVCRDVWMYVFMHGCMYIWMYASIACMDVCMDVCIYGCMHGCM